MTLPGEEIRQLRIKKLKALFSYNKEAYPARSSFSLLDIKKLQQEFYQRMRSGRSVGVAGRIMARREHGRSMFINIFDGSGEFQLFCAQDRLGVNAYKALRETIDIGDFIAVFGKPFYTKRKEPTINVSRWEMLAKSLRPLPEKWHGLVDVEERFRRRYLDVLMNKEVHERFVMRSRIMKAIRSFFDEEGFLEVETPMLHPIAGGALARPFATHHNALDSNLYLRIAPELYLKELLVGGFAKIYELGKSFRNEGIDHSHNPEFTTIEWYAAYWNREDMMKCVEHFFRRLMKSLKVRKIIFQKTAITFPKQFPRLPFDEALKRYALIVNYTKETRDSLVLKARQFGIDPDPSASKGKIADEIYRKVCRPKIQQPAFIIDHPLDISPLAKKHPDDPTKVLRFQLIVGGLEIVNGFSELNDPLDQRTRFEEQERLRAGGDSESHPTDESFIEALEYGMPPAAGAAIGIDRLTMLLTNTNNIKEVILFPTLRPRQ